MSNTWLDIAGAVLDSVDTDYDVISGGLNAAKSKYQEKKRIFHRITLVLFLICAASLVVKFFV